MKSNKKILLVEDDPNFGKILKDYLTINNYEISLAVNGIEGFEKFNKSEFDLCILDIMMPFKDGLTLAKEIREVNEAIPLIFLTAKNLKDDVLKGYKIGADDYLVLNFDDLLPRDIALNKIWRDANYFTSRSMDVYIAKLRKYLEKDSSLKIINVHGEGFRLMQE